MTEEQPEQLLSMLFETLPVGVVVLDADGTVSRANRRAEEVLGLTESDIVGRTYDDPSWVIVDAADKPVSSEELPFARVRDTGASVFEYEHGIRWPDSSERWLSINAAPLSSESGVEGVVAVLADRTEAEAYRRTIEEQNERLAAFASIVSHDLRNPLGVAQGYADLAEQTGDPEHFDRCRNALTRMESLIDDLLVLAREGADIAEVDSISIPELVTECWSFVRTAEAQLTATADVRIRGDSSRLQQLLENLFRNAVEHGGEDVTVVVGLLPDCSGLYVEDDGPGIPDADRERIFAGGYSTSEHGTGFGLEIVQQIVDAHGWEISATASSTGGARFEITGIEFVDDADAEGADAD
jgi:PAS domain S-box-containing protein